VTARKAMLPFNSITAILHAKDFPESTVHGWVKGIAGL
jgi:hypothetical protein